MSDPIDDALKAMAHSQASPDLKARVMASLGAGSRTAPLRWAPGGIAAAAVAAAVLAVAWLVRPTPEGPLPSVARTSIELPANPAPQTVTSAPLPAARQTTARRSTNRRAAQTRQSDHDRALAYLPGPDVMAVPAIDAPPLEVSAMAIGSLKTPAALSLDDLSAGAAGSGDRQ